MKLLRFLQERRFVPLGATAERSVDARVVAATHRDLAEAVRGGRFREDFLYRLNVFSIVVPPLRDRRRTSSRSRSASSRAGAPAGEALGRRPGSGSSAHAWPGNVRELENALERALILAGDGEIQRGHLTAGAPPARARRAAELLGEGSASTASSAS